MKILGIETSCDETAAAIVEDGKNILSNVTATSLALHAKTGGIIPEVASRQQLKFILPVIKKALADAKLDIEELDAIAVTFGPGLIGPLLIGVETAKTLAYVYKKPLFAVNHLRGHIYANWLEQKEDIHLPAIALVVSGGHTDLVKIVQHGKVQWIGGTRDDAAGEAFDKVGRMLGLEYPAGPKIEALAKQGNPNAYPLPKPMIGSEDFDFSFSGLKTASARIISGLNLNDETIADLCASLQNAIVTILVRKTIKAAKEFGIKTILIGGGVAANSFLREEMESQLTAVDSQIKLFIPSKNLCTDNAAMIATTAFYNKEVADWKYLTARPNPEMVNVV